jgi:multidrug resistance efflux pump
MKSKPLMIGLALVLVAGGVVYCTVQLRADALVLTGLVTTNGVIISPQVAGRIDRLLVREGDAVKRDQLLVLIAPDELRADRAYYSYSAEGLASRVKESEAALRLQEQQTTEQIHQAEATLASAEAQHVAAQADGEHARLLFERNRQLLPQGIVSVEEFDQVRTTYEGARARVESLQKQVEAARASLALARSNAEQTAMKQYALGVSQQQQAAAEAQRAKADVRLAYTEIHAPIDANVDVLATRVGEIVNPGQPLLTLINPDDLWVRADVEETYIDRIRVGDSIAVRLPSGEEREGVVFYRGVDAGFATQRDVSRFKRDIKTFEVRLHVDNRDRRLAVGMTAYVHLLLSR